MDPKCLKRLIVLQLVTSLLLLVAVLIAFLVTNSRKQGSAVPPAYDYSTWKYGNNNYSIIGDGDQFDGDDFIITIDEQEYLRGAVKSPAAEEEQAVHNYNSKQNNVAGRLSAPSILPSEEQKDLPFSQTFAPILSEINGDMSPSPSDGPSSVPSEVPRTPSPSTMKYYSPSLQTKPANTVHHNKGSSTITYDGPLLVQSNEPSLSLIITTSFTTPSDSPSLKTKPVPTEYHTHDSNSNTSDEPSLAQSDKPSSHSILATSLTRSDPPSLLQPKSVITEYPTQDPRLNASDGPPLMQSNGPSSESSFKPTLAVPSDLSSLLPAIVNSPVPSSNPSDGPSSLISTPSVMPSDSASLKRTLIPTLYPTLGLSSNPSDGPSIVQSHGYSLTPTIASSFTASDSPSIQPTPFPTAYPTSGPSSNPTAGQSFMKLDGPSSSPTSKPTTMVTSSLSSDSPSLLSTPFLTENPSFIISRSPSFSPSTEPSENFSSPPSASSRTALRPGPTGDPIASASNYIMESRGTKPLNKAGFVAPSLTPVPTVGPGDGEILISGCPADFGSGECNEHQENLICEYYHFLRGCSWDTLTCSPTVVCDCKHGIWHCIADFWTPCELDRGMPLPEGLPWGAECDPKKNKMATNMPNDFPVVARTDTPSNFPSLIPSDIPSLTPTGLQSALPSNEIAIALPHHTGHLDTECPSTFQIGECWNEYVDSLECNYNHVYVGCTWEELTCTPSIHCACNHFHGYWECESRFVPCHVENQLVPKDLPWGQACNPDEAVPLHP